MTLAEYAKTHEELANVGFVQHDMPTAPKIVGLFGGFSLRDVQPLNAHNESLKRDFGPPPEDLGLTTRDEIEQWYAEQIPSLAPNKKKTLTQGFNQQGVCYLDPCWPIILADYMSTLSVEECAALETQYEYIGLNVAEYIEAVNAEHRGGSYPEHMSIPTLQQRKYFINDVIVDQLLKPLFVDGKYSIQQKAIVMVLPFGSSEFAQDCDNLVYMKESAEVVADFMQYLDEDMKLIVSDHEATYVIQKHVAIDINNMTDAQIINNIIYNTSI